MCSDIVVNVHPHKKKDKNYKVQSIFQLSIQIIKLTPLADVYFPAFYTAHAQNIILRHFCSEHLNTCHKSVYNNEIFFYSVSFFLSSFFFLIHFSPLVILFWVEVFRVDKVVLVQVGSILQKNTNNKKKIDTSSSSSSSKERLLRSVNDGSIIYLCWRFCFEMFKNFKLK